MKKTLQILIILFLFHAPIMHAQHGNNEIPSKAMQFIESHFPQYKIFKHKFDREDKEYEVNLDSGHEIKFDLDGNWIEIEGEYSPLPKSIIDLLPRNITQYIAKIILKNNSRSREKKYGYKIELANGIELKFSSAGAFIGKD